ncbi:MAG TPA: arsenate reductase (glutaredoxin) [Burkholderiales bacterium]|jgi:arsenate reductase|nr:arsenate reductase (glutaredoxin) [Burkholderiales bacterium]
MPKAQITIFHNPRCGKSRGALALLRDRGIEPEIIEYLQTPPTKAELKSVLNKLGLKPEQIVRKGEDVYKRKYAGKQLSDEQWLDALVRDPILIERPIVVKGDKAVLARPPERVIELL